jgi:hypothetical protein
VVDGLKHLGGIEAWVGDRFIPDLDAFQVTIRAVCKECNTGWLSTKLENKVSKWTKHKLADLTKGAPQLIFDPSQRELLASWAVKTALMITLALSEFRSKDIEPLLVPQRHFDWLYAHREPPTGEPIPPPPGTTVWMFAANIQPSGPVGTIVRKMLAWDDGENIIADKVDRMGELPKGYFLTFTAGYLGFQVIGWDANPADLVEPQWSLRPTMPPAIQDGIHRLFPTQGTPPAFRWPWGGNVPGDGIVVLSADALVTAARWPWEPGLVTEHHSIPASPPPGRHEPTP